MIELRNVRRRFGRADVLHGISLTIAEGSFTSLLGPSGCGKSTTLRIMAGLDRPSAGQVLMGGRDVSELTPAERNVAMVFQSYALYPHLTVRQNIALPLAMRHMTRLERLPLLSGLMPSARRKRADISRRVEDVARMLGITDLLERKPGQLSGGQQQRAAVGRALVRDPALFLLDEPLSNLDAALRVQMREELTALHRRTGRSFVYVTHDQAEAMSMSDHVVVMMGGRIVQQGAPRTLYDEPASIEVARFIGSHRINLIEVRIENGRLVGPFAHLGVSGSGLPARAVLGLRPEHLRPARGGPVAARLEKAEYLGAETLLHLRLPDGARLRAVAPGSYVPPPEGDGVELEVAPGQAHLFESEGGQRLRVALQRAA
ncbi:MAG: sugar ABC transporter ATP-binding protein [Paracoccaceae bacterium]|nr:MAG: sugar ABC transporter ATP-binding protein [Paracoccaceae bacterium]